MSSSVNAQQAQRLRKLPGLLNKMKHHDKDERFMACVDLTTLLDPASSSMPFRLDTQTGEQVVRAITKQLSDSSAEVQTVAVKLIATMGNILELKQVLALANGLCGLAVDINNDMSRDIYAIGLKNIIIASSSSSYAAADAKSNQLSGNSLPLSSSPSSSAQSHAEVCRVIMKRMNAALSEFVQEKASGSGEFNQDASEEEVAKYCLEVVAALLTHAGEAVASYHQAFAGHLRWLFTHSSEYVRKRCVTAVGALVRVIDGDLFAYVMNEVIIAQMEGKQMQQDVLYSYLQALTVVVTQTSGSDAARSTSTSAGISGYIDKIVPKLLQFANAGNGQDIHDEDEAIRMAILQDNCLLSFTAMIENCNIGLMEVFLADMVSTALTLACVDANYVYGNESFSVPPSSSSAAAASDFNSPSTTSTTTSASSAASASNNGFDDNDEDEDEGWGSGDDDDWMDADDVGNDKQTDDTSWRVRHGAIGFLRTCMALPDVFSVLSNAQLQAAWDLFVDRLKDRDTTVCLSVGCALKDMCVALHMHTTHPASVMVHRVQHQYQALDSGTEPFDVSKLRALGVSTFSDVGVSVSLPELSRSIEQCLLRQYYINEEQAKSALASVAVQLARMETVSAALHAFVACVALVSDSDAGLTTRVLPVLAVLLRPETALDVKTRALCSDVLHVALRLDPVACANNAALVESAFLAAAKSENPRLMQHAYTLAQLLVSSAKDGRSTDAQAAMFARLVNALKDWRLLAPLDTPAFETLVVCLTAFCGTQRDDAQGRVKAVVAFLLDCVTEACDTGVGAGEAPVATCLKALRTLAVLARDVEDTVDSALLCRLSDVVTRVLQMQWNSPGAVATACVDVLLDLSPRHLAAVVDGKVAGDILGSSIAHLSDQDLSASAAVVAMCARLIHAVPAEMHATINAKLDALVCSPLMQVHSALFSHIRDWHVYSLQAQGEASLLRALDAFVRDRVAQATACDGAMALVAPCALACEVVRGLNLPPNVVVTNVVSVLWVMLDASAVDAVSSGNRKSELTAQAALVMLGRIGSFCDATQNTKEGLFQRMSALSRASSSEVKTQTGVCMGGCAVGNPRKHVPALLEVIQAPVDPDKVEDVVRALQGLLQCLTVLLDQTVDHSAARDTVLSLLEHKAVREALLAYASHEREAIVSLVHGVLGALCVLDAHQWAATVSMLASPQTVGTAVSSFHVSLNLVVAQQGAQIRDVLLKFDALMPQLLALLEGEKGDETLKVKREVLMIVNACLNHFSEQPGIESSSSSRRRYEHKEDHASQQRVQLLTDAHISDVLLPFCYAHAERDAKLVVTVDYGPFKQENDRGLPLRRAVFQTLSMVCAHRLFSIAACATPVALGSFFKHTLTGLADKETDIQIVAYTVIMNAVKTHGASVLLTSKLMSILDKLPEAIFPNVKIQLKAAKTDKPERAIDVLTACVKCMYAVACLPGYERLDKFYGFYQRVLNTERLKLILKDITRPVF